MTSERRSRKTVRMQHDLIHLKSRRDALKCVYSAIGAESFTEGERDDVDKRLRECDAEILEKELAITHHAEFVQTTLAKCASDIACRESTLNKIFSSEVMREHQSMMTFFSKHHDLLKSMVNDDSDASELTD